MNNLLSLRRELEESPLGCCAAAGGEKYRAGSSRDVDQHFLEDKHFFLAC